MSCLLAPEEHLFASPLSLEMWMLLVPVEYVDLPNVPTTITPDAWYTAGSGLGKLCTWTAVTIEPNTDPIWIETRRNYSS